MRSGPLVARKGTITTPEAAPKGWGHLAVAAESGRGRGFVVEDLLDLVHEVGGDLLGQLEGLAVVLDLLRLGGAEDDGARVRLLRDPGEGELGGGAV